MHTSTTLNKLKQTNNQYNSDSLHTFEFAMPPTSSLGIANTYIVSILSATLWDTERIEEDNDCNSATDPLEFA